MKADFRELIAQKVTTSWKTMPHFFVTREVDAEALLAALDAERSAEPPVRVTLTDLLVRALGHALAERSASAAVDVGLAVATERGVMMPVLRDVLGGDFVALAQQREAAVERSRAGRLTAADLQDPPFCSLSNLGAYGVDAFTGVIALEQASLLTLGRIAARVVADDTGTPVVRRRLVATLNADHRRLDGADAAQILTRFADAVTGAPAQVAVGGGER